GHRVLLVLTASSFSTIGSHRTVPSPTNQQASSVPSPERARSDTPWHLTMWPESKPKLSEARHDVAIPRRLGARAVRVDPLQRAFRADPGELPLGQLARGGNTAARRLLQTQLALQMRPQLPVAHGAQGRQACVQVT